MSVTYHPYFRLVSFLMYIQIRSGIALRTWTEISIDKCPGGYLLVKGKTATKDFTEMVWGSYYNEIM